MLPSTEDQPPTAVGNHVTGHGVFEVPVPQSRMNFAEEAAERAIESNAR